MKGSIYQIILFFLVHVWLLLNKSYFWDDWIWIVEPEEFRVALNELGFVFFKSFFYQLFSSAKVVFLTKLLVFGCFLTGSGLFYATLSMFAKGQNRNYLLYAGILFAVLPYNIIGRSTLCTASYAVSFLLFCLSYFSYVRFRFTRNWLFLIFAVLAATYSFNTTSFLVLYIVMYGLTELLLLSSEKPQFRRAAMVVVLCLVHAGLFFVVKQKFFPAHGYYHTYNKIHFTGKMIYSLLVNAGPISFFEPIAFSFLGRDVSQLIRKIAAFIYTIGFYLPLFWAYRKKNYISLKYSLMGVILILASIFPYLVVGKSPDSFSWNSRHELLLPFGAVFWFLGVFYLFSQAERVKTALAVLVVFFSFGSVRLYLSVQGLHFQQMALAEGVVSNVDLGNPGAYVLVDKIKPPGIMSTGWDFYILSGILNLKSQEQNHAIILDRQMRFFNNPETRQLFFSKRYMLANAKWEPPFYCLTMSGKERISELEALKLLFKEVTSSTEEIKREVAGFYQFNKALAQVEDSKPICPTP